MSASSIVNQVQGQNQSTSQPSNMLEFKIFPKFENLEELLKGNFDRGHLILWKAMLESEYKLFTQSIEQGKKIKDKFDAHDNQIGTVNADVTAVKANVELVKTMANTATAKASEASTAASAAATVAANAATSGALNRNTSRNQSVTYNNTLTVPVLTAWRDQTIARRQLQEFVETSGLFIRKKAGYRQRYEEVLAGIPDVVRIAIPKISGLQKKYIDLKDHVLKLYNDLRKTSIEGNRSTLRRWSDKFRGNRKFFGGIQLQTKRAKKRKQTKRVTPLIAN
jgi:hypothetical protein